MKIVRLGDVAAINPAWDKSAGPDDPVSFVGMANMSDEAAKTINEEIRTVSQVRKGFTPFRQDDLLVAKITPCFENGKIGRAAITNRLGAGSTEFHVVRPGNDLDGAYALQFLRHPSFRAAGELRMTGSGGQRRVPAAYVADRKIPLPPIDEQRRIAAILDKADELRTKRRKALAHLDTLTQSIFHSMFGDPVRNDLGWPLVTFGDVAPSRLGKMLDKKVQTGKSRFRYLRNANVQWFKINTDNLLEMDFSPAEQIEFTLRYGDVLVCEGGEPGRAAIWRDDVPGCFFQKALHRVRPNADVLAPEYLVQLLWSLAKGGGLDDHVTSATIAHLTGEKLKRMQIPVPPWKLQQTFATRAASVERSKELHRKHLVESNALFASLQHRAFKGEL